jgi:hypothetical protein
MPSFDFTSPTETILKLASAAPIYRGILGWPKSIDHRDIRNLVEANYLRLFYDWQRDRVLVKITPAGQSRYNDIICADLQPLDK